MKIQAGRPSTTKKALQAEDLKPETKRVCADLHKETYKKFKQKCLNEEIGMLDLVRKVLEEASEKW